MFLEGWFTLFILAKVLEELLKGLGKGLVLGILIKLLSDEFEFIHNPVGVEAVTVTHQVAAMIEQLVPLLVGLFLQNISLFAQTFPTPTSVKTVHLEPNHSMQIFTRDGGNTHLMKVLIEANHPRNSGSLSASR